MKRRFVDAHIHLWDKRENPAWYDFPTPDDVFGKALGWKSHLPDVWLMADHCRVNASVDAVKFVHVVAVTKPSDALAETRWLSRMAAATGYPNAIIGSLDITQPFDAIARDFYANLECVGFRGIRLSQGIDPTKRIQYGDPVIHGVMRLLADNGLVYEAVAHPDGGIAEAAKAAVTHPDLPFLLEHSGWPLQRSDQFPEHFRQWQAEVTEFASLDNTAIKLSGLGMVYHKTSEVLFRPYFEYAIETFGPRRCVLGSNFPVDDQYGDFSQLIEIFEKSAIDLSEHDNDLIFSENAERIYRI